jgi:3'(2'), 5'-bisphosphate nucleotidase
LEASLSHLASEATKIAEQAGLAIMKFFEHGDFKQYSKDDASPVTSADYAANDVVIAALQKLTPNIPIMSEETEGLKLSDRVSWPRYWLIDPLDGTQEFVAGRGDFAVNIALIEHNQPVLGIIHAPVSQTTYWAVKGEGTFKKEDDRVSKVVAKKVNRENPYLRVAISRVQTLETITRYIKPDVPIEFISMGSCALKCCLVAEGEADIYLRVGPTGEWDTGAPQVIVEEAGGSIIDSEFGALTYNQRESFLNPDFVVNGDATFDWSEVVIPHHSRRD